MSSDHSFSQRNKSTNRAVGVEFGDGKEAGFGQNLKEEGGGW